MAQRKSVRSVTPRQAPTIVFEYLYRDASNYKAWGELGLTGTLRGDEEERIRLCLDSREFFIPEQIGIPSLQAELYAYSNGPTEDDHPWHEFHRLRPATSSDEAVAVWGSISDLLRVFQSAGAWNPQFGPWATRYP